MWLRVFVLFERGSGVVEFPDSEHEVGHPKRRAQALYRRRFQSSEQTQIQRRSVNVKEREGEAKKREGLCEEERRRRRRRRRRFSFSFHTHHNKHIFNK
jgi:hypothetical protein